MGMAMKPSAMKVQETLQSIGLQVSVIEFSESTRTAQDAANALKTSVGQIAKSLVFMAGDRPILIIASGVNRIDLGKMTKITGLPLRKADADRVRDLTGFSIGGIPPVGHKNKMETYIDEDLMQYLVVFAAAGTPNAVFPIEPRRLVEITAGKVVGVK
jgi:prolyl-tRNA editing enzyme YbaK/EbsC (Cys-tRNA(Pro) deacylase)